MSTPEGIRRASSPVYVMRKVAPQHWCGWMCPGADKVRMRGEAPMVDLPDGRKLFVLFTRTPEGIGPLSWLGYSYAIKSELGDGQRPQHDKDRDLDGDGTSDLPTYSPISYLVTFRDLRDPPQSRRSIQRTLRPPSETVFGSAASRSGPSSGMHSNGLPGRTQRPRRTAHPAVSAPRFHG